MAGRKIDKIMFWVPQSGHLGLGISILSYAGSVMLGVATDAGLVPDPERIVENFEVEFQAMKEAAERRSKAKRAGGRHPSKAAAKRA